MKRFVVACLLASAAVPAQAFQVVEFTGQAIVTTDDYSKELHDFSLKGYCFGLCQFSVDAWGGGLYYFEFHTSETNVMFAFTGAPIANPLDGQFHNTGGYGYYNNLQGGFRRADLNVTGFRSYDDGLLVRENNLVAPQISYGPKLPEPTTWAMMIGGLGVVGAAMRRRTTKFSLA